MHSLEAVMFDDRKIFLQLVFKWGGFQNWVLNCTQHYFIWDYCNEHRTNPTWSASRIRVYYNEQVLNARVLIGPDGIHIYENEHKEPTKSQIQSDVKAVNEKKIHPIKQEKQTLELPSTNHNQANRLSTNENQIKSTPARPPSAVPYDVPNFQNQDDVNLYVATLISENEALKVKVPASTLNMSHIIWLIWYGPFLIEPFGEPLNKKDLALTAQKWQSAQENKKIKVQTLPDDPPSVKRSQSFQSTKSDEKDIRIRELEKQLAKSKGIVLSVLTIPGLHRRTWSIRPSPTSIRHLSPSVTLVNIMVRRLGPSMREPSVRP